VDDPFCQPREGFEHLCMFSCASNLIQHRHRELVHFELYLKMRNRPNLGNFESPIFKAKIHSKPGSKYGTAGGAAAYGRVWLVNLKIFG
jgi:hypothetical protein